MIRKYFLQIALVAMATLAVWGCTPDDDFPEPLTDEYLGVKASILAGTWKLESVTAYDESLRLEGAPTADYRYQSANLETVTAFGQTSTAELQLTLNVNGSNPSTFTTSGNATGVLPPSGTWTTDHPVFATQITLTGVDVSGVERNVVIKFPKSPTGINGLELRTDRVESGAITAYYIYRLTR